MAQQAQQANVKQFSPAQTRYVQELARRMNMAQQVFNEFGAYLAEEHGVLGDGGWQLDVERGAWVRIPVPPAPNGNGKKES